MSKELRDVGPIPGQSLTNPPGGAAWERPPRLVDIDEIVMEYMSKFDDPEEYEPILEALDAGLPLTVFVKMLTRRSVMAGMHTMDASIVVQPIIHEFIKALAEEAGIKVNESAEDLIKEEKKARFERVSITNFAKAPVAEDADFEPLPEDEQPIDAPTGKGLMEKPKDI